MLAGSIFTSSLSGSCSRRPIEIALRWIASHCGKLLAADLAGRVHARAGLVDHHVMHVAVLQLVADDLGDQLLGLPAGRAVADGHDADVVLLE